MALKDYKPNNSDILFLIDLVVGGLFVSLIYALWYPFIKSFLAGLGTYYLLQFILDEIKRGREI